MSGLKLTDGQRRVLVLVQRHAGHRGLKGMIQGADWRRLDRLETLGLVERCGFGSYRPTLTGEWVERTPPHLGDKSRDEIKALPSQGQHSTGKEG